MNENLLPFSKLPDSYTVLDTETTGLPDDVGPPGIVTLGITKVENRKITESFEFKLKPYRTINEEARSVHGITNLEASTFDAIDRKWPEIKAHLDNNCIVIHNASFDWPIIEFHISQFNLKPLKYVSVFCSQKTAIPFAKENNIPMSSRGPSLDSLTAHLNIKPLRINGLHGAEIDTKQTALVVEELRKLAKDN